MKIKIISSKEDIESIGENEDLIHFAFRPSMKDVLETIKKAPNLSLVEIPESYSATISRGLVDIFEMKGITLIINDVWGHRSDIDEYAIIPVEHIKEMAKDGTSVKNISALARVNESLVNYVLR